MRLLRRMMTLGLWREQRLSRTAEFVRLDWSTIGFPGSTSVFAWLTVVASTSNVLDGSNGRVEVR